MEFEKHKQNLKLRIQQAVGDKTPTMSEAAIDKAVDQIVEDLTGFQSIYHFTDGDMENATIDYYAEYSKERDMDEEMGCLIVDVKGRWLGISGLTGDVMFT
ncbi:MAG TPA: hypothetical protein VFF14_01375 [Candidatus Deferrimicrobium sp.]|nr:hypothetical protein [Candidatus Deferrimicrobium sp.]